jgi:hypothetical protein
MHLHQSLWPVLASGTELYGGIKGTHRFSNCSDFKRIMTSMREGIFTDEDRDMLHGRVIDGIHVKMPDSAKVWYATFFNNLRCMVNADVVDAYLSKYHKGCTATNIPESVITTKWGGRRRVPLSCDQRKVLFEQCPEYTIKDKNSRRCDPLLCLFDGCHVMGIENEDVENGIANGTTCIFKRLI